MKSDAPEEITMVFDGYHNSEGTIINMADWCGLECTENAERSMIDAGDELIHAGFWCVLTTSLVLHLYTGTWRISRFGEDAGGDETRGVC